MLTLTLLTGGSGSGKTARVLDSLRAHVERGERVLLLVPEQQTVTAERLVASALPPSACISLEVTNFTRLSDTVFRLLGGLAERTCTPGSEQVLMWRTLTELAPHLHTARRTPDAATVSHMCSLVGRLRASRITPAMLEAAATDAPEATAAKFRDYALICSVYHGLLTEYYSDESDRLDRTALLLQNHNPLDVAAVYVDGFSSFTGQQYAILQALLSHHPVTVTLCVPPDAERQLCSVEVFATRARLLALAREVGARETETDLGEGGERRPALLRYISRNLFRMDYRSQSAFQGEREGLTLVEAPDPQEACDYICADILRRVMEEGCRYRDFAVICGSASSYEGILDTALARSGIPCFLSRTDTTDQLDLVQMLLSAYRVVLGGWRREDVIAYLKCLPDGADPALCDLLELYTYTWDIHGARWYDGKVWEMNPDGYGAPRKGSPSAEHKLKAIDALRQAFVPPLYRFGQAVEAAESTADHVRALTSFLLSIHFPETAETRAKEHPEREQLYAGLWNTLCTAMDTLTYLLPDTPLGGREFAALLEMQLGATRTGQLPSTVDEVTVGEASLLRTSGVPHVYLLGANEGEFPPPPRQDDVFTEEERLLLVAGGASTLTGRDEGAARELYSFWRAFSLGQSSVTLLWSRTTTALEGATPSSAVERVRHLAGEDYPVVRTQDLSPDALIWSVSAARERVGRCGNTATACAVRNILEGDPVSRAVVEALDRPLCNTDLNLSPETAALLYPGDLSLSQTRIGDFLRCPLAYLLRHTLKLRETPKGQFDALSIGTFFHEVLERFFDTARKRGMNLHTLSPHEQATLLDLAFPRAVEHTLPEGGENDPRTRHLLAKLKQNVRAVLANMCEELTHSKFAPAYFELNIREGDPHAPAPVTFPAPDGSRISVVGVIDRVDTWKEGEDVFIRVVDYKTAQKKFTEAKLKSGEELQMPLYLFSLLSDRSEGFRQELGVGEGGRIRPAGVLYLSSLCASPKIDRPLTGEELFRVEMNASERSGLVVDDPAVLAAMDDTPDARYLPVSFKKSGEYTAASLPYVRREEELGSLLDEIGSLLGDLGGRMKRGVACATPLLAGKAAAQCESCPYKPVCRNTHRAKRREGQQAPTEEE